MKNIIKYIFILVLGVVLFTSCEEDPITISEKIVGFDGESGSVTEPSTTPIAIPVFNAAASGAGATVSFSFSTEGIDNPAIEGVDFTVVNATNSLTFANSYATDSIYIQPIDNGVYDQNKTVHIILGEPTGGYQLTTESTYTLTIVDDEHPLATWIGNYTGTFAGHGTITTEAYSETQLRVHGLASYVQTGWGENWVDGDGSCIMDFNDDGTVVIEPQWIGDSDYPDVYGIIGEGTYESDGTITITYQVYYGWTGSGGDAVFNGNPTTVLTKN